MKGKINKAAFIICIVITLGLAFQSAASGSVAAPDEVILYEHIDYVGKHRAWRIAPGDQFLYVPYVGDDLNDRISSIHVGSDVHVWLFKDAYFAGAPFDCMGERIDKSVSSLHQSHPDCADRVSSLIIGLKSAGDPIGIDLEDNAEYPFYDTFVPVATTNIYRSGAVECFGLKKVAQMFKPIYQNVDQIIIYPYSSFSRIGFHHPPDNLRKVSVTVFDRPGCTGDSITIPGPGSDKVFFDLGKYGFNDRAASLRITYTYKGPRKGPKWTGEYPSSLPFDPGKPKPVGGNRRVPASSESDQVTATGDFGKKDLEGSRGVQGPGKSIMDIARRFENNTVKADIPGKKPTGNYASGYNTDSSVFQSRWKKESSTKKQVRTTSPHPSPPGISASREDIIPGTHSNKGEDSMIPDITTIPSGRKSVKKKQIYNTPHVKRPGKVVKAPEIGRDLSKGASLSGHQASVVSDISQIKNNTTRTATVRPDVINSARGRTGLSEKVKTITPPSQSALNSALSGRQTVTAIEGKRTVVNKSPSISQNTTMYVRKTIPMNQPMGTASMAYTVKKSLLSDRELKAGMKGKDVAQLQQVLKELGFKIPGEETGGSYFGRGTHSAVVLIQKRYGLKPTGVVDAQTAGLIEELLARLRAGKR